jgi:hypothetical protein
MKLGVANRICIIEAEATLADTVDIQPRYADVVFLFQAGHLGADEVAQAWLGHMWGV